MTALLISLRWGFLLVLVLLLGPVVAAAGGWARVDGDWRTASRESTGIAPDPAVTTEAVVQVYGARAFAWRGAFAVHTWVAAKRANAPSFTTYEVIGWRYFHGGSPVTVRQGPPDRKWFGSAPEIYRDLRGPVIPRKLAEIQPAVAASPSHASYPPGPEAERMIGEVETAVAAYPFKDSYRTWPGPNSNTFTAFIARSVPGLGLDLPPTAIGKDYLGLHSFAAAAPSGTGYQLSLLGVLGITVGLEEGLEFNVLGLSFGIDPLGIALRLPGIGHVGPKS